MRRLTKLSSSIARHPISWTFFSLTAIIVLIYLPLRLHYVELETSRDLPDVQYGDMVAGLALLVSTLLAVFSIIPNLKSLATASRFTHYSELDHMYNELLKLAIEHPELREPARVSTKDRGKYETYAFMVWNFLETIHDRCADDVRLRGTWAPIIRAECDLHKQWFREQTIPYDGIESPKFCLGFCDFIWRTFYVTGDASSIRPNRDDWIDASWDYRDDDEIREDDRLAAYIHPSGDRVRVIKWHRECAKALKRSPVGKTIIRIFRVTAGG